MRDPLFRMALVPGLLSAVGPFAIDMSLPALPQAAGDLATTEAGAALTLTACFLVFGVAIFAAALAPGIGWLIAARAVQGRGAAALSLPRLRLGLA